MRNARMFLCAIAFMALYGPAIAQTPPPPQHIRVVSKSHLDIMSSGQFSGKISLAVGTQLDVDGVDGEYVLVHIHMLHGRVLAKDTDIAGGGPEAIAAAQASEQAAQARAPQPGTTQYVTPAPRAAVAAPTSAPRSMVVIAPGEARIRSDAGSAKVAVVFITACFIASFILVAGYWRLLTKAGKPGWAILVPIYNAIVMQQISGKPLWWIFLYLVPGVNIVIAVICTFALAENFGKGKGYGLGMLFLPWVFVPMLAFSDAEFVGTAS
jgi:Family of unknown function (DUF5684)